ncbi:MAG: hypothetical protein CO119_02940 [Flavobacteriales bacterium CG_4_9_14_3_um_filter_40_17]|nr:MAG: hypothetical protein CO119_02940 [Flavobacteriales bacterium CG_4_9_14_3_um_filter_40_17]
METVHSEEFETSFKIKNVGKNVMNNIFIKGICSCTTFDIYKKSLQPTEEQKVNITITLFDEKAYFLKEIYVYGSFYPYLRKIQIVGNKN